MTCTGCSNRTLYASLCGCCCCCCCCNCCSSGSWRLEFLRFLAGQIKGCVSQMVRFCRSGSNGQVLSNLHSYWFFENGNTFPDRPFLENGTNQVSTEPRPNSLLTSLTQPRTAQSVVFLQNIGFVFNWPLQQGE